MKKRQFIIWILLFLLISTSYSIAGAQNAVEVTNQDVEYEFGKLLSFHIEYQPSSKLESISLFIQASGAPSFVGAVSITGDGQGRFVYDLESRPLPAFSNISYFYQFSLTNGQVVDSPSYQFTYLDNRFNWQELIEEPFKIYWYEGEITLAQEVLDAAIDGQDRILDLLQRPPDNQPVTIFIYNSNDDLSTTLNSVGQTWVGGHANPEQGSVVVALPRAVDQPLEIQRLIPHELTHIYLYRFMGPEYDYLPAWFSEGLASQMEAYNLPEYDLILERAASGNNLIPIAHICQAFPTDPELALLSYAQGNSLVGYLRQQYGIPAIQSLIFAYDQGLGCERGVEEALGMNLAELEQEWQSYTFGGGKRTLMIYILIAVLIALLVSLGLFIFTRTKQGAADDWGDDDFPESESGPDNQLPDDDFDIRLEPDNE